jgi:spore coat polysaccharide biosynthesis protein SpsF
MPWIHCVGPLLIVCDWPGMTPRARSSSRVDSLRSVPWVVAWLTPPRVHVAGSRAVPDPARRNALAVVQARMSSTRLPGKVLADVAGEPMLVLLLKRLARTPSVARIVVATSEDAADDPVAAVAEEAGFDVHRGPLNDVLARFVGAAAGHDGPIVRVTGDCPLTDPAVVDAVVRTFVETPGAMYASNVEERTFPDGLDVEAFSPAALALADRLATDPFDREHVTPVMQRHPDRFPSVSVVGPEPLGDLRWTVDDPSDLEFLRAVAARLGEARHVATMSDVLDAVRRAPSLSGPAGLRG